MTSDREYKLAAGLDLGLDRFADDAKKAREALNNLAPAALGAAGALNKLADASEGAAKGLDKVAPAAKAAATGARELTRAAGDIKQAAKPAQDLAAGLDKVSKSAKEAEINVRGVGEAKPATGAPGGGSAAYSGKPNQFLASDPEEFFRTEMAEEEEASKPKPPVITAAQAARQAAAEERRAAKEALEAQKAAAAEAKRRQQVEEEAADAADRQRQAWGQIGKLFLASFHLGSITAGIHHFAAEFQRMIENMIRLKNTAQSFGISRAGLNSYENFFALGGSENPEGTAKSSLAALRQKLADARGGDPQALSDLMQLGLSQKDIRQGKLDDLAARILPGVRDSVNDPEQFARAQRVFGENNVGEMVSAGNSPAYKDLAAGGWRRSLFLAGAEWANLDPFIGRRVFNALYGPGEYQPNSAYPVKQREESRDLSLKNTEAETLYHISRMNDYAERIGALRTIQDNLGHSSTPVESEQNRARQFEIQREIDALEDQRQQALITRRRAPLNNVNEMQSIGLYRGGIPDPGVNIQRQILQAAQRQTTLLDRLIQVVAYPTDKGL